MTADRIAALLRKYRVMRQLRDAHAGNEARAELRALAQEFPGALRELDRIESEEIDRRITSLQAATESTAPEWAAWMDAYHTWMRRALAARHGKEREGLDPEFLAAVLDPPDGRIMIAVFDRLARDLGRPREEIWDALFPSKTSRPYRKL